MNKANSVVLNKDICDLWTRTLRELLLSGPYYGVELEIKKYVSEGYDANNPQDYIDVKMLSFTTPEDVYTKLNNHRRWFTPHPDWIDKTDIALGTNIVLAVFNKNNEKRIFKKVKLDIIDVEPGHSMNEAEFINLSERYTIVQTRNSFHLYPKHNVIGDNGGKVIQDILWSKGFVRVSESPNKGPLRQLTDCPETITLK